MYFSAPYLREALKLNLSRIESELFISEIKERV